MKEPLYHEHAGLVHHADQLLGHMGSVKSRLQFGEAHISWHTDWADRVLWLHGRLRMVRLAIDHNEYPSAFALARTGLEHHLFDRLFFLADRAALVQRLEPADDQVAYVRQLDQLKADPASDIEDWRSLGKRRYELVRASPAFENEPTHRMSYLNLLLKEFDPFLGKTRLQERLTRRFTAIKEMERYAKENEEFRQDYFTSARLRRNLEVADLATEHERMQIDVHLDFLSAFVHGSPASYDAIYGGRKQPASSPPYDHYCSELALLYVIRIAGEELLHFERALSRPPATQIRDWTTTARDIELADQASAHFWFLWPQPTSPLRSRALRRGRDVRGRWRARRHPQGPADRPGISGARTDPLRGSAQARHRHALGVSGDDDGDVVPVAVATRRRAVSVDIGGPSVARLALQLTESGRLRRKGLTQVHDTNSGALNRPGESGFDSLPVK